MWKGHIFEVHIAPTFRGTGWSSNEIILHNDRFKNKWFWENFREDYKELE